MFLQDNPTSIQIDQRNGVDAYSIMRFIERNAQETGVILFYNHENPFTEWLGNFYPLPIKYNGFVFLNSEAAFQAQKFTHSLEIMSQFTRLTGDQAFRKSRQFASLIRSDWREARVKVMKEILAAKIEQNPVIAYWLEATGNSQIIEHNPVKGRDAFWSDDNDGSGKNMLGILWMQLRSERRWRS